MFLFYDYLLDIGKHDFLCIMSRPIKSGSGLRAYPPLPLSFGLFFTSADLGPILALRERKNMGDSGDNAIKQIADDYRAKRQFKADSDAALVAKQKIVEAQGPAIWSVLRSRLKDKTDAFNVEMVEQALWWGDVASNQFTISRDDGAKLTGQYDAKTATASFRSSNGVNQTLKVSAESGRAEFVSGSSVGFEMVNSVEDIANGLLRDFSAN